MKVLVTQLCPTLCDPMDCKPARLPIHGIPQAWILEWVANPFSRESSGPRDWTLVSRIAGRSFTIWATREAQLQQYLGQYFPRVCSRPNIKPVIQTSQDIGFELPVSWSWAWWLASKVTSLHLNLTCYILRTFSAPPVSGLPVSCCFFSHWRLFLWVTAKPS